MTKPATFTVADLAERIARVTGQSAIFHARQLRHWASLGLFPDASFPVGGGPTAPRQFGETHIVQGAIFAILSGQGFTADQLDTVRACLANTGRAGFLKPVDGGHAGYAGIRGATEWAKTTRDDPIYFYVHASLDGAIGGGAFDRAPDVTGLLSGLYPVTTVLRVDRIIADVLAD